MFTSSVRIKSQKFLQKSLLSSQTRTYTPARKVYHFEFLFLNGLKVPVTVAYGDGIGPEITASTIKILESAGSQIEFQSIDIGEKLYLSGHKSGIAADSWDSIRKSRILLKAPITTPVGGGYKSLNVTIRKTLGLYANVRPCRSYYPFVATKHPKIDVVIVRENEEDLYAGIEHQQTDQVLLLLKSAPLSLIR
jgi:isocitrate dehydrogenase